VLLEPEPLELDLEPAPGERTEPTLGSNLDLDIDGEPPVHRAAERDDQPAFTNRCVSAMTKPRNGLSARDDEHWRCACRRMTTSPSSRCPESAWNQACCKPERPRARTAGRCGR
jgi:hypothetical protein